jgi:hypothetical protein
MKRRASNKLARRMRQRQQRMTRGGARHAEESGVCRRGKLRWWIKIQKRCAKGFGKDSRWDRKKSKECNMAWNSCNTGFWGVCCSQPEGPKTIGAYCEKKKEQEEIEEKKKGEEGKSDVGLGKKPKEDQACQISKTVQEVGKGLKKIQGAIKLLEKPMIIAPAPAPAEQPFEEAQFAFAKAPAPVAQPSKAPSSAGAGVSPSGNPLPPDGILKGPVPAPSSADIAAKPDLPSAPPPAAAPSSFAAPSFAPAGIPAPRKLPNNAGEDGWNSLIPRFNSIEARCDWLSKLTSQAAERILEIKVWAETDGMKGINFDSDEESVAVPVKNVKEDPEARDPELVWSVRSMLKVGEKLDYLLASHKFCTYASEDDDDDDDDDDEDEDDISEDLKKDPASDWDDDDDSDDEETQINATAILELIRWEEEMMSTVNHFETKVHPSGFWEKWWRYRFEYCIVESFVFFYSVLLSYVLKWCIGGRMFQTLKFYKTGQPRKLYGYAMIYWMFRSASCCIALAIAYGLYVPWGEHSLFQWWAELVRYLVDGAINVPYNGRGFMYLTMDVQFQIFATFCAYTLFITMLARHYSQALEDWKQISIGGSSSSASNAALYAKLDVIMRDRLRHNAEYRQDLIKYKIKMEGEETGAGWATFKLHLYLTDAIGKSMENLVEVSPKTYLVWAVWGFTPAVLAYMFELAYMYFLPGFILIGILLLTGGYLVSKRFIRLAEDLDYHAASRFVTVSTYCRSLQIIMYCVFYSFARLLLSFDIFTYYPYVYFSALFGFVCVVCLLAFCSGEMIKGAVCALSLVPHIEHVDFKRNLEHIVSWQKSINCHETGVEQYPIESAYSTEWAGKHAHTSEQDVPKGTPRKPGSFFQTFR